MRLLGMVCFALVALLGRATAENSVLRLHLPPPTKFETWAAEAAAPWSMYAAYPTLEGLDGFLVFLHQRFVAYDVPTLYLLMQQMWLVLSPVGSKGASRQATTALAFTLVQIALTVSRLRSVLKSGKWPRWFQHVWKALPESHRHGISTASFAWFQQVASWCKGDHGSSAVYIFFTHAATYIGKANTSRKPVRPGHQRYGLPERLVEHAVGLLFPRSRDGALPRYKILRNSFSSMAFLPLAVFQTESQALAMERALIVSLKPAANGADWAAILAKKRQGRLLNPRKVLRRRPPLHLRSVPEVHKSVWDQLRFSVQAETQLKAGQQQEVPLPKKPFGKLYSLWQDRIHATTGCHGPLPLFGEAWYSLFIAFIATRSPTVCFPHS